LDTPVSVIELSPILKLSWLCITSSEDLGARRPKGEDIRDYQATNT